MYRLRRGLARLAAHLFEPKLARPVLVLESDDWGAGSLEQASALRRLSHLLSDIRDAEGNPACMTIGLVLGTMDRGAWAAGQGYVRRGLDHPLYAPIVDALRTGMREGVFAIQWHGLEHYWPEALLASRHRPEVAAWLAEERDSEVLPKELQSRWTDASCQPSLPLAEAAIEAAVAEEARLLARLFGQVPEVAVPNTFLWTDAVEKAWARHGVRFVVTPGQRYTHWDAARRMRLDRHWLYNTQRSRQGVYYLVRDVYFEPARGDRPERLLQGLGERAARGRPCLVETHRFNYLGAQADLSLAALERALREAKRMFPDLRFASSQTLGKALLARTPGWVRAPSWLGMAGLGVRG